MVHREYNYGSLVGLVNKAGGNRKVSKEVGFDVRKAISRGLDTGQVIALCEKFKVGVKDLVKYDVDSFGDVVSLLEEGEEDNDKSILIYRAVEEYKKGKSVYRIGKELNVPESTLKAWLVREGVYKPFERAGRVTDETVAERNKAIVEEIKTGVSASVLAEKYNLSLQSIYNIINKKGLELGGKTRLYTDEQKQRALEEYLSGKYTAKQVSKRTGVGIDTVYAMKCRSLKVIPERPKRESKIPLDEVVKLYKEGVGTRVLSNLFDVNEGTVKYYLKKLGVYEGKRDIPRKNPKKDKVIILVEQGLSVKEICSQLDVSQSFVSRTLQEKGVTVQKFSQKLLDDWQKKTESVTSAAQYSAILEQLADEHGVCKRTVISRLKSFGVTIPRITVQEKKDQIVKLFKEGVTPIEIGSRLDCSKTYVYQVLEENGIERKVHRQEGVISSEDELEIADLYKDGKNATQIAVKYKTNSDHIYEILKRQGVEIRTRSSMSQEVLDNIISLTGQMMPKEIAEKLGISLTTVYTVQKKNNVSKSDT